MSSNTDSERRFWRKVNKTATCWLWTGRLEGDGYASSRGAEPIGVRLPSRGAAFWWMWGKTTGDQALSCMAVLHNPSMGRRWCWALRQSGGDLA
jgi:hypothetical protein